MAYANEAEYLDDLEFWLDCNPQFEDQWFEEGMKADEEKSAKQKQPLMYYADLVGRSG